MTGFSESEEDDFNIFNLLFLNAGNVNFIWI